MGETSVAKATLERAVSEDDDVFIVLSASCQELPGVEKLVLRGGSRPVVLFKLKWIFLVVIYGRRTAHKWIHVGRDPYFQGNWRGRSDSVRLSVGKLYGEGYICWWLSFCGCQ